MMWQEINPSLLLSWLSEIRGRTDEQFGAEGRFGSVESRIGARSRSSKYVQELIIGLQIVCGMH